jgi:hypothetical protein
MYGWRAPHIFLRAPHFRRVPHISILRCGFQPQPAAAFFFCQKPQQNRVSSLSTPQNPPNSHQLNHINPKNSWHSSFPPTRIIKAVEMREKPGACVGLLLFASAPKKSSFISPDGVRKRASCAVFPQEKRLSRSISGGIGPGKPL